MAASADKRPSESAAAVVEAGKVEGGCRMVEMEARVDCRWSKHLAVRHEPALQKIYFGHLSELNKVVSPGGAHQPGFEGFF